MKESTGLQNLSGDADRSGDHGGAEKEGFDWSMGREGQDSPSGDQGNDNTQDCDQSGHGTDAFEVRSAGMEADVEKEKHYAKFSEGVEEFVGADPAEDGGAEDHTGENLADDGGLASAFR